ncbi:major capsid protein [Cystobacter fuscus]|uniref:Major capsid protein n=1 Tax=Cystobacter fuscus TaxID=43 RepID=A0A250JC89_9BACT|nr:phage major capsid protein [Cystobacter fuscus]ATB41137.1 major capsid protein [Cystobacter fuscus]
MKFPAALQRVIAGEVAKAVAAQEATRTRTTPADTTGKGAAGKPDLRTAIGLRMKSLWMHHPMHAAKSDASTQAWVKKSASAFESVFGQGGSLLAQEYSSEIIELLRPRTVLLRAGARKETYNGKLNIGRLNGGAVAEFVAEGQAPKTSKVETGAVILGSHKLMGIYEPSNDLLRNPSLDSAGLLADDLLSAVGVAADKAGVLGDGTGPNPLGITKQVKASNKVAGVAITQANRDNVITFVDTMEQRVKASNLVLEGNQPFWSFSSAVETALKGLRFDSGGFIYRDQLDQGKLNGKPVHVTEAYGDNLFLFGLASQIYFGMDTKAGDIILDMAQPHFAEDLTMIKAIMYVDWQLRHNTAVSYSDDVTLS